MRLKDRRRRKVKGRVLYGWRYEGLSFKIQRMLELPLGERYDAGLVTGFLAKRLAENQKRLYGIRAPGRFQVLQLPSS